MSWFEAARQTGIILGGLGAFTFPIYYWWTNPRWYRFEVSRFLMFGGLGWASLYLAAFVGILIPSDIIQNIIRVVLIVSAGTFAWYQVWMLRRVRKYNPDKERRG